MWIHPFSFIPGVQSTLFLCPGPPIEGGWGQELRRYTLVARLPWSQPFIRFFHFSTICQLDPPGYSKRWPLQKMCKSCNNIGYQVSSVSVMKFKQNHPLSIESICERCIKQARALVWLFFWPADLVVKLSRLAVMRQRGIWETCPSLQSVQYGTSNPGSKK